MRLCIYANLFAHQVHTGENVPLAEARCEVPATPIPYRKDIRLAYLLHKNSYRSKIAGAGLTVSVSVGALEPRLSQQ